MEIFCTEARRLPAMDGEGVFRFNTFKDASLELLSWEITGMQRGKGSYWVSQ